MDSSGALEGATCGNVANPALTPFFVARRNRVRVLITGITGFAGGHLAQILLDRGEEVFGVDIRSAHGLKHLSPAIRLSTADLGDPILVANLVGEIQPEAIYHLAGQPFVPTSWDDPWGTIENNIRPQLNILQAIIQQQLTARLLIVASNQVYGKVSSDHLPVREETPFRPENPYGVSKVAQDMLALQYHVSHGVDVLRVRAFNHIGPRQNPHFVSSSFAKQIAEIEAGLTEPVMQVGNLEAQRDFTDVVDVMRAYALLIERGDPGEAYNVGTGRAYSIQYLLDVLLDYSQAKIRIEQDPERMRPSDVPVLYADNTKLRAKTAWEPIYSFEESLQRVLDYWRNEINEGR
jgi:GDP-4-dehydro-6-deoxy-D-mannose reductase